MHCHRSAASTLRVALTIGLFVVCGALTSVTLASPPAEVTNVLWCTGSNNCAQWDPVAGATQYRVHRGEWASLPCVVNPALDSCDRGAYTTTTTGTTVLETPAPGACFWFLVTAVNGSGEGSPGSATTGPRTVNTTGTCTPTCAPTGAACVLAGDCCSSSCLAGTCLAACCQPTAAFCTMGSDCCSGLCSGSVCQGPCTNNGGPCTINSQCCSAVCSSGTCQGACTTNGGACTSSSQCCSNLCTGGACQTLCTPAGGSCALGSQCCSGQCSGGTCLAGCTTPGGGCATNSQCCSGLCSLGTCTTPTCTDGVKNGTETDVDCGGGVCPTCALGKTCAGAADCASGLCQFGVCTTLVCNPGYADCNNNPGDGCEVDTTTNVNNCGGCNLVCPALQNASHACVNSFCVIGACDPGYLNCDNVSANGCEVYVAGDPNNCSGCGMMCSSNHIPSPTCSGGLCNGACSTGYSDCNGNKQADGCEINVASDPNNCSGCGMMCSSNHIPSPTCSGGLCNGACSAGYSDCNGNKQADGCEINVASDPNNCSGCGMMCSSNHLPSPTCSGGLCNGACSTGYSDCNGNKQTDGCEINVAGDPTNCGGCGIACSSNNIPSPTCSGGSCNGACTAGHADCNGNKQADGCEINVASDPNNCSGCGMMCSSNHIPSPTCAAGSCNGACNAGYSDCNGNKQSDGCEVNLQADNNNCGTCGHVCPPFTGCVAPGVCFAP